MKGEQLHLTLGTGKSHEFAVRGELHLRPNPEFGRLCDLNRQPKLVDAPFERAITAGKNSYVYDAHTYHTKVPHRESVHLLSTTLD